MFASGSHLLIHPEELFLSVKQTADVPGDKGQLSSYQILGTREGRFNTIDL